MAQNFPTLVPGHDQCRIQRPVFSEPKTWEKKVTVGKNETTVVNFVLTDK